MKIAPLMAAAIAFATFPALSADLVERGESPAAPPAIVEQAPASVEAVQERAAEAAPAPADVVETAKASGADSVETPAGTPAASGAAPVAAVETPSTAAEAAPEADTPQQAAQEPAAAPADPASPASVAAEAAPVEAPAAPADVAAEREPAPAIETAAPAERIVEPAPAPAVASEPAAAPEMAPKAVEAAAPPPPSPVQTALRAAVQRLSEASAFRAAAGQTPVAALRRERDGIVSVYEARDFAPLWIAGESFTPAARAVLARIERAREDGLDLGQYVMPTLDASSPEAMARIDLALSQIVVGYARQASGVRVEPRTIGLITAKPDVATPEAILAKVPQSPDAGDALAEYNPPQQGYRDLREKLFELRRERPAVAGPRIAPGPVLKVGMKDPRVPLVRARFGINASADQPDGELLYDTRIASAVADFQRAHGLPANGALTARTIALLSGGDPSRLESEIIANMERWRWAPRDMGETRIEVNVPDFRARLIRNGKVVHSMRVIVGKPETPTPIFSDTMEFLVVNPSWHVPQSIIRKQLASDPNYYARNGYEVVRRGGNVFVRQPPGERNALGHIKFMFPNDHAVYMHDTPSRGLFASARRAYSHGCVRVDQPFQFAEALMPETGWSGKRLRSLVGRGERTVKFGTGVPVHLMYFTAYVDDDGKMQLREDLYGQTRKLQAALGI